MRLGRRSRNVQDRRGRGVVAGGGIGVLVLALVGLLFGVDPRELLEGGGVPPSTETDPATGTPDDAAGDAVAGMLGSTEDVWEAVFAARGADYPAPTLVLFTDAVQSACGVAESTVGPFYCPRDRQVYIDLGFFRELSERFGAPGDFAQAYVIAHEVGHHIQNVLGLSGFGTGGGGDARAESVRTELQADCLAGVWAYHAQTTLNQLEAGDVEEALGAAAAIGDDRLQRQSQGQVVPETFTHGSSAQRVQWFRQGLESGTLEACDTRQAALL